MDKMDITRGVPCAATFSKDKCMFGPNFPISYITDASGSRVKGNDGAWYLDWISGLGANLLGYDDRYANDGFYAYIGTMIRQGITYSMPHQFEYTVANKLTNMLSIQIPYWNNTELQVRWVLSGSDACSAAIRLAKARKQGKVYSSGYHGFGSEFIAATPPAHGLYDIRGVKNLEFGSLPHTQKPVSAIIIEIPPTADDGDRFYFEELRKWCDANNALLIIDEVVTGLRYARGGACELFNIKPDIVCMGKSLGGGMPIGAVIARTELMDWFNPAKRPNNDPVFVSSTNAGCLANFAAANFILDYIKNGKYLTHIYNIGDELHKGLLSAGYNVIGNGARNLILWEDDIHKGFTINYFAKNKILLNRPNFANMTHSMDDVELTIDIAKRAIVAYKNLNNDEIKYWQDNSPITMFRNR